MKNVIVIFGPTAVGKSDTAVQLAKKMNGEIISADSIQIYQKLNIGSAKIAEEEMQGIKHYLLDIVPPEQEFSVGQYVEYAERAIAEILEKGKVPIIVGGTGLYLNALIHGFDFCNTPKDEKIRAKYNQMAEENGTQFVYDILKKCNPERAGQLHPNDVKRVVRALEIFEINKKDAKKPQIFEKKYNYIVFGLNQSREILYDRINRRVVKQFDDGLLNEVNMLLKSGLNEGNQSMQGIGYKEVIEGLNAKDDVQKIIEKIQQNTRNYAKRQLTFMRGMKELIWIEQGPDAVDEIIKRVEYEKNK